MGKKTWANVSSRSSSEREREKLPWVAAAAAVWERSEAIHLTVE